ncbi:MAG: GEVED domain-containing protein [Rhodanobacteraceae bacterium]
MNAAWRVAIASGLMFLISHSASRADTGFPQPYCQWGTSNAAPITHVDFAGFVHNSDESSNALALEDFRVVTGSVVAGDAPGIYVEARSGGGFPPYPIRVAVYFDWNRDGDFDDRGEDFDLGWLQGGGSGGSQSGTIKMPVEVADGATRNRIARLHIVWRRTGDGPELAPPRSYHSHSLMLPEPLRRLV